MNVVSCCYSKCIISLEAQPSAHYDNKALAFTRLLLFYSTPFLTNITILDNTFENKLKTNKIN